MRLVIIIYLLINIMYIYIILISILILIIINNYIKKNDLLKLKLINFLFFKNNNKISSENSIKFSYNHIDINRGTTYILHIYNMKNINTFQFNLICIILNFNIKYIDFNFNNIIQIILNQSDQKSKVYFTYNTLNNVKIHGFEIENNNIYKRIYEKKQTDINKLKVIFTDINFDIFIKLFNKYHFDNATMWEKTDYKFTNKPNAYHISVMPLIKCTLNNKINILSDVIENTFKIEKIKSNNILNNIKYKNIIYIAFTKNKSNKTELSFYYI